MQDEKYVVFKKDVWEGWLARQEPSAVSVLKSSLPRPLDDLTVIRHQDLFAAPALHAYANGIALTLKGFQGSSVGLVDAQLIERLRRTADYFHEAAVNAEAVGYKFPD